MGRKATVVRTETTTDDEAEEARAEAEKNLDVPLFTDLGDTDDTRVEKVTISREDPDEGFLGTVDGSATELEVFQRWGGSKYLLTAKNSRGRILTKRTLKLAGEPVFMSEVAEMRWRRANGLKPKAAEGTAAADGAYTAKELMAIIESKAQAAREEAETREEKRRREDADREAKAKQDEREWRERMEKDKAEREQRARTEEREHRERMEAQRREDDKRREDRIREDEARREKEHERAMQATLAAAKESQEKNQQFFTNMLAMTKANDKQGGNTMEQVTQVLTLVEALKSSGSGEPQDAVTALLSRLPETLQAAGSMVGGAIREAKGLPPVQQGGEGSDGGGEEGGADPSAIKLTGNVAAKMKELVMTLVKRGQDPEKVLVAVADHLIANGRPARGKAVAAARGVEEARAKGKPGKHARARRKRPAPDAKAPPRPAPAPAAKPAGAP